MSRLKIPLALFVATVLVALGAGCGGAGSTACVVVDASHSTRYALADYLTRFEEGLEGDAGAGASVAAVVATGNPQVEAKVERVEFADLTGTEKTSIRIREEEEFASDVDRAARLAATGLQAPAPGSGIVGAIDLVAGEGCDSLTVLSDGLETEDIRMKVDDILTQAGRERLLDRLEQRGRLPDLSGVELRFPLGGYLPQGTQIPRERLAAVPLFWQAYAERSGASLTWRG